MFGNFTPVEELDAYGKHLVFTNVKKSSLKSSYNSFIESNLDHLLLVSNNFFEFFEHKHVNLRLILSTSVISGVP